MEKYLNIWFEMIKILHNFITTPNFKKTFIYGIILYIIALLALIRGDIYYNDDWINSFKDGYWNFSRYLSTFILSNIITLNKGTLDLSPIPQILGIVLIVISSMILLYLIRKKFDLLGIIASLPLGLSPHFLQNLSYKFDSLTMGLALFLAIFPFLFKNKKYIFILTSIICLLLMFMTYQAANGTYIILSLYFAFSAYFIEKHSFKESIEFLIICIINLVIASLIYKFVFIKPILANSYATDAMITLGITFFNGIWANLTTYLTTIFNDLKQTPYIFLIALICMLFIINTIIYTNRSKIITILSTIVFIIFGFCLSYGLYLVLQKPLFEPRAFYGFNAFIAILCIINISFTNTTPPHLHLQKITHYTSITIIIITAYFLISFANIYGNALKKQDEYLDFRAKLLLEDLSDRVPQGSMVNLKIYLGYSTVTKRFIDKYGDISRLVPKVAENDWFFHWRLQHLNAKYNDNQEELCNFVQEHFNGEIIFKNAYHRIEKVKTCYIVTIN